MQTHNEKLLEDRIKDLQSLINMWTFLSVGFFFCFVVAMFYILFTRVV